MLDSIKDFFLIKLPVKLRKRVVVDCFSKTGKLSKRALLYYKTDSFYSSYLAEKSVHTNDAEILYMINELDKMGFIVDLADRQAKKEQLSDLKKFEYDVVISNCAGNSSPYHHLLADELKYKSLIAYAMGPDPKLSVEKVKARHADFQKRSGVEPVVRRLVNGEESEWDSRFSKSTGIIVNGDTFSADSYKRHNRPIYYVPSTISEHLKVDESELNNKSKKTFLYFGGSGLICKGLDIVLDAFDGLTDLKLHVCGPPTEQDFWEYYGPVLARNPQIEYHGFVDVAGPHFKKIALESSFNIFPTAAEGCATSVLTTMKAGVIPVVNYEAGVRIGNFGIEISEAQMQPEELRKLVLQLSEMEDVEIAKRVKETYKASFEYNKDTFVDCFRKAIDQIMEGQEVKQ